MFNRDHTGSAFVIFSLSALIILFVHLSVTFAGENSNLESLVEQLKNTVAKQQEIKKNIEIAELGNKHGLQKAAAAAAEKKLAQLKAEETENLKTQKKLDEEIGNVAHSLAETAGKVGTLSIQSNQLKGKIKAATTKAEGAKEALAALKKAGYEDQDVTDVAGKVSTQEKAQKDFEKDLGTVTVEVGKTTKSMGELAREVATLGGNALEVKKDAEKIHQDIARQQSIHAEAVACASQTDCVLSEVQKMSLEKFNLSEQEQKQAVLDTVDRALAASTDANLDIKLLLAKGDALEAMLAAADIKGEGNAQALAALKDKLKERVNDTALGGFINSQVAAGIGAVCSNADLLRQCTATGADALTREVAQSLNAASSAATASTANQSKKPEPVVLADPLARPVTKAASAAKASP